MKNSNRIYRHYKNMKSQKRDKDDRSYNASIHAKVFKELEFKFIIKHLTKNEKYYLSRKIYNAFLYINNLNCVDNYRLALFNPNRLVKKWIGKFDYDLQKDNGCCGFYDEEVKLNSSKIVLFGFNFGH